MKTSIEWWNDLKVDEAKMIDWLQKQYVGEVTAAGRIEVYCMDSAPEDWVPTLQKIAGQERLHASWIADLLSARGLATMNIDDHKARYWDETLGQIESFETAAAVAAHAEEMRLDRIRAIANDEEAPSDIRQVFQNILKDEVFHAKAFTAMAGSDALARTLEAHINGCNAIGLINVQEVL